MTEEAPLTETSTPPPVTNVTVESVETQPAPGAPEAMVTGGLGGGADPQDVPPSGPPDTAALDAATARIAELEAAATAHKTWQEAATESADRISQLETQVATAQRAALMGTLTSVPQDLRAMVADRIGVVDVSTDSGKTKVQQFLETHPSLVQRQTAGETVNPLTAAEIKEAQGNPLVDYALVRKLRGMATVGGNR